MVRIGGLAGLVVVMLLSVACDDKSIEDSNGNLFLQPPLGAAFGLSGQIIFFDLGSCEVIGIEQMNGYSASAEFAVPGNFLFAGESQSDVVLLYSLPRFTLHSQIEAIGVTIDLHASIDASQLYVLGENGNFRRIDLSDPTNIDTLGVGLDPRRMTLRYGEQHEMWIACRGDSSVYIVNLNHLVESAMDTLKFEAIPTDIGFSPFGHTAYVALAGGAGVHVISAATRAPIDVLPGDLGPYDLDTHPDGTMLAGADSSAGVVRFWDLSSGGSCSIPVGGSPGRVRFSDDRQSVFVMSRAECHVLKIDVASDPPTVTDTLQTPDMVLELALWERP